MAELPDAKRWFQGFIDVTRWIKDIGTIIRIIIVLAITYVLVIGGMALYKHWMPKPKTPTIHHVETIEGKCEIMQDKQTKWGFINLW